MAAVSAVSCGSRPAIMETEAGSGRLESDMATRYRRRGSGKLASVHRTCFHGADRRVRFALHDYQTRRHLFARLLARPNFIISRVCGQMAVVFGQLPHVGTVGRQRDGRVVGVTSPL